MPYEGELEGDPSRSEGVLPVQIDGEAYEVSAVMPRGFRFPSTAQLWTPVVLGDEVVVELEIDPVDRTVLVDAGVTLGGFTISRK